MLDWPGVESLLADLEACTTVTEIIPKAVAQGRVEPGTALTLGDPRRLLADRGVRGLQIRYRYEGADWWDTLLIIEGRYRLVRIRHDFAQESDA